MVHLEETSGYVRPKRVNKWPNSVKHIWWWWWWWWWSYAATMLIIFIYY